MGYPMLEDGDIIITRDDDGLTCSKCDWFAPIGPGADERAIGKTAAMHHSEHVG